MVKAFLPQPVAVADGAELLDGEISQHSYAAEFVRTGARRVRIKLAVGNGSESGVPRHLERALVVASSRTREVVAWVFDNGFDLYLRIHAFALQFRFRHIGEIGMRHRMAADLKSLRVEIARLDGTEVTGSAHESSGEVKGCVEAELAEHWRGGDKISFAAIVEGDTNARFDGIAKSFADVQAAPARLFDPRHLAAEGFERQNVAHVAGLGLGELTASDLQLVVHQEHNA